MYIYINCYVHTRDIWFECLYAYVYTLYICIYVFIYIYIACCIFPGNQYVTAAKSIVSGVCGIDMHAGPSEVPIGKQGREVSGVTQVI